MLPRAGESCCWCDAAATWAMLTDWRPRGRLQVDPACEEHLARWLGLDVAFDEESFLAAPLLAELCRLPAGVAR